jgi:hypothetical protein
MWTADMRSHAPRWFEIVHGVVSVRFLTVSLFGCEVVSAGGASCSVCNRSRG